MDFGLSDGEDGDEYNGVDGGILNIFDAASIFHWTPPIWQNIYHFPVSQGDLHHTIPSYS